MVDYQNEFKIARKVILSSEDLFILTELYMPIIGVDSFGLYFTLASLRDKETYLVKRILDNLNFIKSSDLEQSLVKLEALGLLKRYQNKDEDLLFDILKPLSYSSFFSSPLLTEYLCGQIGTDEVEKIRTRHLKKLNTRGYSDITKSFDEVYKTSSNIYSNVYGNILNKSSSEIVIKEVDFDYLLFKMSFDGDYLKDVLNDDNFRKKILEISHVYHLTEEEMKDVVLETINNDKELTFDYISKNARKLYRQKSNSDLVKLETKNNDNFVSSALDDETYKLISWLDHASFADVLKTLSGITPAQSELRMFEELMKNTKFSSGMINVMILYVSTVLDGQIPGYNYFEKIANVWARANIKNTLEAHKYIIESLNRENKESKKKYSKSKKVVETPQWYDDYLKDVENAKSASEELTEEEIKKIFEDTKDL